MFQSFLWYTWAFVHWLAIAGWKDGWLPFGFNWIDVLLTLHIFRSNQFHSLLHIVSVKDWISERTFFKSSKSCIHFKYFRSFIPDKANCQIETCKKDIRISLGHSYHYNVIYLYNIHISWEISKKLTLLLDISELETLFTGSYKCECMFQY